MIRNEEHYKNLPYNQWIAVFFSDQSHPSSVAYYDKSKDYWWVVNGEWTFPYISLKLSADTTMTRCVHFSHEHCADLDDSYNSTSGYQTTYNLASNICDQYQSTTQQTNTINAPLGDFLT